MDINPFMPFGIDADTMRLIDLFLLACLIDDSPQCDAEGQRQNTINLQRMVNRGRETGLTLLSRQGVETPCRIWLNPFSRVWRRLHSGMTRRYAGNDYQRVVDHARQQIRDPELTLSARILREMESAQQSFWQLALRYSREWHSQHLSDAMPDATWQLMTREAEASLQRQQELEAQDSQPFETYLSHFYDQYQSV